MSEPKELQYVTVGIGSNFALEGWVEPCGHALRLFEYSDADGDLPGQQLAEVPLVDGEDWMTTARKALLKHHGRQDENWFARRIVYPALSIV